MTQITAVASFRRVTPGIVASARLAMANDVPDVTKSEIALLLKRAAPVLGIDGTAYHVMDILLGLSRAEDWKGAGRPIVAISNAKLAEYTMRSERTVMRCIRRLVEVGIAAYRDSATGRRFVYRDKQGDISVGYGIDFTPSRVRAAEIRVAVEQYQVKLNRELAAKRDISRLTRAVEDLSNAFPENSATWREQVVELQNSGLDIERRAEALSALHAEIVVSTTIDRFEHNLSCEGDISVMPNTNTTHESIYISNNKRPRSNEREDQFKVGSKAAYMALEKKPPADARTKQAGLDGREGRDPDTVQGKSWGRCPLGCSRLAAGKRRS
ncbi:plasmid replication protein RepC [Ensifer canadensis]|uniref:plasmid replication protein RepC n=1 Tax=Ensifer canadensis TaxID=555315 RepID=UPI0035E3F22D